MKTVSKYLPISLLKSLNNFNKSLSEYRDEIEIKSSEEKVSMSGISAVQVNIKYIVKDRNSYFEIIFVEKLDYLYYNYYPNEVNSSKTKSVQKQAFDSTVLKQLESNLEKWKNNITELFNLEDPLDFFSDNFIKSYSAEIIDFVGDDKENEYFPLTIERQLKVIELIEEQQVFVETQINETSDKHSEKYKDLNKSLIELEYIKENLPRMTEKELKERWSSTFAVLIKWCAKQLAFFAKIDAQSDGNISRSIGNLIGGIFNIPKMD